MQESLDHSHCSPEKNSMAEQEEKLDQKGLCLTLKESSTLNKSQQCTDDLTFNPNIPDSNKLQHYMIYFPKSEKSPGKIVSSVISINDTCDNVLEHGTNEGKTSSEVDISHLPQLAMYKDLPETTEDEQKTPLCTEEETKLIIEVEHGEADTELNNHSEPQSGQRDKGCDDELEDTNDSLLNSKEQSDQRDKGCNDEWKDTNDSLLNSKVQSDQRDKGCDDKLENTNDSLLNSKAQSDQRDKGCNDEWKDTNDNLLNNMAQSDQRDKGCDDKLKDTNDGLLNSKAQSGHKQKGGTNYGLLNNHREPDQRERNSRYSDLRNKARKKQNISKYVFKSILVAVTFLTVFECLLGLTKSAIAEVRTEFFVLSVLYFDETPVEEFLITPRQNGSTEMIPINNYNTDLTMSVQETGNNRTIHHPLFDTTWENLNLNNTGFCTVDEAPPWPFNLSEVVYNDTHIADYCINEEHERLVGATGYLHNDQWYNITLTLPEDLPNVMLENSFVDPEDVIYPHELVQPETTSASSWNFSARIPPPNNGEFICPIRNETNESIHYPRRLEPALTPEDWEDINFIRNGRTSNTTSEMLSTNNIPPLILQMDSNQEDKSSENAVNTDEQAVLVRLEEHTQDVDGLIHLPHEDTLDSLKAVPVKEGRYDVEKQCYLLSEDGSKKFDTTSFTEDEYTESIDYQRANDHEPLKLKFMRNMLTDDFQFPEEQTSDEIIHEDQQSLYVQHNSGGESLSIEEREPTSSPRRTENSALETVHWDRPVERFREQRDTTSQAPDTQVLDSGVASAMGDIHDKDQADTHKDNVKKKKSASNPRDKVNEVRP